MAFEILNFALVKGRLPFVKDPDDAELVEMFRLETVYALMNAFDKTELTVDDEVNYTGLQRSLIADIVSCYMILRLGIENSGGNASTGAGPLLNKFLKKAKADVVEAEFDVVDATKSNTLFMNMQSLLAWLKKQAMWKAHQMGFILDICDDCTIAIEAYSQIRTPFIVVVPDCPGCGC